MINLQEISKSKKLYDIVMPDGKKISLKMPTQKLFQQMLGIQNKMDDPIGVMDAVYDILTEIFNLNIQGIKYQKSQIEEELDLQTAMLVIQDYVTNTTQILGE